MVNPDFSIDTSAPKENKHNYVVTEVVPSIQTINLENKKTFERRVKFYNSNSQSLETVSLADYGSEDLPKVYNWPEYIIGPDDVVSLPHA